MGMDEIEAANYDLEESRRILLGEDDEDHLQEDLEDEQVSYYQIL